MTVLALLACLLFAPSAEAHRFGGGGSTATWE